MGREYSEKLTIDAIFVLLCIFCEVLLYIVTNSSSSLLKHTSKLLDFLLAVRAKNQTIQCSSDAKLIFKSIYWISLCNHFKDSHTRFHSYWFVSRT